MKPWNREGLGLPAVTRSLNWQGIVIPKCLQRECALPVPWFQTPEQSSCLTHCVRLTVPGLEVDTLFLLWMTGTLKSPGKKIRLGRKAASELGVCQTPLFAWLRSLDRPLRNALSIKLASTVWDVESVGFSNLISLPFLDAVFFHVHKLANSYQGSSLFFFFTFI